MTEGKVVTYRGETFDISEFIHGHPGGEELLNDYIGKDITEAFDNASHGASAMAIMNSLRVKGNADVGIDVDKPITTQVIHMKKEDYIKAIDSPIHLKHSVRLFAAWYLEMFSLTPWWVIPIVYWPISYVLISLDYVEPIETLFNVAIGVFLWTLLEYCIHRFLFHSQDWVWDNVAGITFHFFMHGIHHLFPMDGYRLVFPPALGLPLGFIIWSGLQLIFDQYNTVMAGVLIGYVMYDCTHYWIHHCNPTVQYFKDM
jgi:cytochrome b involved in lipid metabolism